MSARYGKLQVWCTEMTNEGIAVNEEGEFGAYLRCPLVVRCHIVGGCGYWLFICSRNPLLCQLVYFTAQCWAIGK
jgi:hypothetical protein